MCGIAAVGGEAGPDAQASPKTARLATTVTIAKRREDIGSGRILRQTVIVIRRHGRHLQGFIS
jgi:hypothetical protein